MLHSVKSLRQALLSPFTLMHPANLVLLTLITFSNPALAAPIYQETLQGNGETRLLIERSLNVAESGRYFLTLKNGDLGPRNIEQCESEDTVSAKRECLFENLNERIEQNFTRMRDALIHVNGVRVRHSLAPNERTITQARGLLKIPVELTQGVNTLKVDYLGYSTAKLHLDLEKAPETPSAPFARFLLNRITGNTTQEFRLNAKESFSPEAGPLTYAWTWGDEAEGFVPVPSVDTLVTHTYQTAGTYHAKLVVTDTLSGLSSEFGIDLVVTAVNPNTPPENESPKPIIQWAVDPLNPMRVTFNASQSSDDGEITSYVWRFTNQSGQHTNLTGETLTYTFFNPGSYTVRLGVTDNLGKTAYQTRVLSLAPLSELVHDEILLTQNNYSGTFETEAIYTENINIPEAKLGKIRIKNADGQDYPIQDCSLIALPEKIGCLYDNLVNRTYVQLYRVSSANIYVNGRKVTDSLSINKQKKDFETVVSLNQTNTIEVRVRGWPTAFVNVEIQALETNLPPVAIATHGAVKRGAPQAIEFQALQSSDPNDQVVSYRFQAKLEGASNWALDTDWQASGFANLTFPSVGRWQVLTSARDKFGAVGETENLIEILPNSLPTLQITYGIYTNQSPYRVQVRALATDADGDDLLYNFAFSNGQTTGLQGSNTAISMFNVTGNQSVTVTVRDQNGGETVGTASFVLGGNLVPIASFSFASPRAGYAPHTVSFDASNSSDPDGSANDLQYFWNFGDGTTGTGKLVDHTFQLGGEHIVALTVLDPQNGAGSQSRAIFSWTNEPPVPRYTITAVPGTLQRIFDASASTPGDSAIQRYNFETGDGNFIVQTTPVYTHTYLNGGVYNTSLRVYDAEGDANITGQTITVFNGQKPAANINLVSADVVTPAVFVLNADGSATPNSGATLNGWRWTLPNGETRLGPSLTYETSQHGNFSITLEVRDSFGFWSDPVTQEFSATSGVLPIARIETNKTTALVGEPIRFSGLTSSTLNGNANLVSYEWTTPNGSKLYGPEVDIGLSQPGLKTITLVVTDSKGYVSNPTSLQVNIVQPTKPIALFTLSDAGNTIPIWRHADGRTSHATSPGASIIGYEWRMQAPDALPSGIDFNLYGPEVDLLFDQAVTYTVSLRVFDSAGGTSDWASQTFGPLQNSKPVANLLPGSITVTAPAIINFSSFGSFDPDGHSIISYYWNMGDGWERYEPSLQHQYNLPGVYTVELAVQDSFGLWSDPVFATVTVVENQLPVPIITMQDDPGGNRFKKSFSALQSSDPDGTIVQYNWFLSGSPVFSNSSEVDYTFTAPGHYTMGLGIVDNNGGASVAWYSLEILENQVPVIRARYEVDDMNPMRFSLDGSASTDDTTIATFVWRNGADVIGTSAALSHTFSGEGIYNVSLEITDVDGASASKNFAIYAFESGAAGFMLHEPSDNAVDPETGISYIATEPIPMSGWPKALVLQPQVRQPSVEGLNYSWRINDVEISNGETPQIVFTNPGQTKLSLVVKDGDNILAKLSRAIDPDTMSCRMNYSDEEIKCLTLPGPHSIVRSINGTDFSIPLGPNYSEYQIDKVTIHPVGETFDDQMFDLSEAASIQGENLLIPKEAIVSFERNIAGAWRMEVSLIDDSHDSFQAAVPYFVFEASTLALPELLNDDVLLIRDSATGLFLRTASSEDGPSISVPSTDLEIQLSSKTRKPALGSISTTAGYYYGTFLEWISDSDFNELRISIAGIASTPFAQSSSQMSVTSNSNLSRDSNVVAFVRTNFSDIGGIGPDYVLSSEMFRGQIPLQHGRLKGNYLPWNSDDAGSNPDQSSTRTTRHLECAAYEVAWNRTAEIDELNSRYHQFLAARELMMKHSDRIYPLEQQLGSAASTAEENGFRYCGLSGHLFSEINFQCMIDYLQFPEVYSETVRQALLKIQSIYPQYLHYKNLGQQDSMTISSGFNAYFSYGENLGFDNSELNYATWRKLLMPASTFYQVTAKYRIPGQPGIQTLTEYFSSTGMRGTYQSDIHAHWILPANVFETQGVKTVKIPFNFPANATGIEFEIKPNDLKPEISTRSVRGGNSLTGTILAHTSTVWKQGSASCRLATAGYEVTQVHLDAKSILPEPSGSDLTWIVSNFSSWSSLSNVVALLQTNDQNRRFQRFTTYIAQSILKSGGFLAVDFDRAETTHSNPLTAVTSGLPDYTSLVIPVKISVDHFNLPAPDQVIVQGAIATSITDIASLTARDPEESTANRSVYKFMLPYNTISAHLRNNIVEVGNLPLQRDYQLLITPQTASGSVSARIITLKPLLNAKYLGFMEGSLTPPRNLYGGSISAFVEPTMAAIINALEETGSDKNDFYLNDGSLPFGKRMPGHSGHDNGQVLDIRTFGVANSNYETFNKLGTQANQMFATAHNTKFKDIALLIRISNIASEYYNTTPIITKLKSELQCAQMHAQKPEYCNPANEITMEKCLFLQSTEAEAIPACANLQTHVYANLDKNDVKVVHNRYRDYVMRNREALYSFKQTVQNERLPMPLIIYSSGSGDDVQLAIRAISNLPIGSGPIENEWNTRSLKQGTIPIVHPPPVINPIAPIQLCLLKSDGSTIGEAGDLPILRPDGAATHLDHYHLSITGR